MDHSVQGDSSQYGGKKLSSRHILKAEIHCEGSESEGVWGKEESRMMPSFWPK